MAEERHKDTKMWKDIPHSQISSINIFKMFYQKTLEIQCNPS